MNVNSFFPSIIIFLVCLTSCQSTDPLSSWEDGDVRSAIIDFVQEVTDPSSPDFVPKGERIAVFDNDGTLWAEKPYYFQLMFMIDQIQQKAKNDPSILQEQPYKALMQLDVGYLKKMNRDELLQAIVGLNSGSIKEFQDKAKTWLSTSKHPRYEVPFLNLTYKPMLELLEYLRQNGFKVYISTGGGADFVRSISENVYGIPPEQVIGSSFEYEFVETPSGYDLLRKPKVHVFNDKAVKPVSIHRHIGKIPIVAVGNSDGDIEMLLHSQRSSHRNLQLLLHHDDSEREYDYDRGTEKALKVGEERKWKIISIQNDFKRVFEN